VQRSTSPPPLARRVFPDRAAGLLLSPVATGSAQGLVPMFSRGRATASIELPSERPALAVLLLRVLPFASGRSRLNDWRRSDRRLQPNSGFQRWRTACGRGPVIPIRDDGAPGGASPFPRRAAAVPFLGTPSRAGRRPRGPLPYRPPSFFQSPHTSVVRSASSDPRSVPEERKAVSRSIGRRATHGPRRQGPPEPKGSASFRRRMSPSRLLSSSRASRGGMAPGGNATIETSPATRYRAPCFG
jgi:hypothetical protein